MTDKTALLLVADGTEEMEAVITADVLRRAGVVVTIANIEDKDIVTCSRGIKISPDERSIEGLVTKDYDVVILPGGLGGAKAFAESSKVGAILQKQFDSNKLVAAICAAPTALQAHGIAKGKKITSYPSFKDKLEGDYVYLSEKVVIDGNLITSQGPATAYLFGLAIAETLVGKAQATSVAKGMLCDEYK